jgi:hypothetical protein
MGLDVFHLLKFAGVLQGQVATSALPFLMKGFRAASISPGMRITAKFGHAPAGHHDVRSELVSLDSHQNHFCLE